VALTCEIKASPRWSSFCLTIASGTSFNGC
jgi:hypothetical protein